MSDKIYCKAVDVENKTVCTYEVEACKSCGKWHVVGWWARFCEWCGASTGNDQLTMLEVTDEYLKMYNEWVDDIE